MRSLKQPELYKKLINAYTDDNLNIISSKLVELYKQKRFSVIRGIANKISDFIVFEEEKYAKFFSRLVVLYHPDKGLATSTMIKNSFDNNDLDTLPTFFHFFLFDNLDLDLVIIDNSIEHEAEYT